MSKTKIGNENKVQVTAKREKNAQGKVKAGNVIKENTQITDETADRKTLKKLDKQYEDILAFPETGKVLLFKNENYKVSVKRRLSSLCMSPIA